MPSYQMQTNTAATAAAAAAPQPDIDPVTGKPDWSRHNATIVGNQLVTNVRRCIHRHAAGLQCEDCSPGYVELLYTPISFGATREYKDDQDGWQTVGYKKKGRKARQWRDLAA